MENFVIIRIYGIENVYSKITSLPSKIYAYNHKPKRKRPPYGGLKNTNDEKNLFRKIQTEYKAYCFAYLFHKNSDISGSC